ncbi:sin3b-related [Anaeramoeba ignava]|uniref:Sin3b-related n=1 Tax=Anaeramoeba ignava TaxID=1746090 RepID=A0A9Q0LIM1_ANAIG|nr:sin3b-related [Anaeramoeba ignava]
MSLPPSVPRQLLPQDPQEMHPSHQSVIDQTITNQNFIQNPTIDFQFSHPFAHFAMGESTQPSQQSQQQSYHENPQFNFPVQQPQNTTQTQPSYTFPIQPNRNLIPNPYYSSQFRYPEYPNTNPQQNLQQNPQQKPKINDSQEESNQNHPQSFQKPNMSSFAFIPQNFQHPNLTQNFQQQQQQQQQQNIPQNFQQQNIPYPFVFQRFPFSYYASPQQPLYYAQPSVHQNNVEGKSEDSPKNYKFEFAIRYLDEAKAQFQDRPEVFEQFLQAMKEFKMQIIDLPTVLEKVKKLFAGHDNLISKFNHFLTNGANLPTPETPESRLKEIYRSLPHEKVGRFHALLQRFQENKIPKEKLLFEVQKLFQNRQLFENFLSYFPKESPQKFKQNQRSPQKPFRVVNEPKTWENIIEEDDSISDPEFKLKIISVFSKLKRKLDRENYSHFLKILGIFSSRLITSKDAFILMKNLLESNSITDTRLLNHIRDVLLNPKLQLAQKTSSEDQHDSHTGHSSEQITSTNDNKLSTSKPSAVDNDDSTNLNFEETISQLNTSIQNNKEIIGKLQVILKTIEQDNNPNDLIKDLVSNPFYQKTFSVIYGKTTSDALISFPQNPKVTTHIFCQRFKQRVQFLESQRRKLIDQICSYQKQMFDTMKEDYEHELFHYEQKHFQFQYLLFQSKFKCVSQQIDNKDTHDLIPNSIEYYMPNDNVHQFIIDILISALDYLPTLRSFQKTNSSLSSALKKLLAHKLKSKTPSILTNNDLELIKHKISKFHTRFLMNFWKFGPYINKGESNEDPVQTQIAAEEKYSPIIFQEDSNSQNLNAKNSPKTVFYGNKNFYIFFRLYGELYQRILQCEEEMNSISQGIHSENTTQTAQMGAKKSNGKETPIVKIYQLVKDYISGKINFDTYRDNCNNWFHQPWKIYYADRLIGSLIQIVTKIMLKPKNQKLISLLKYESAKTYVTEDALLSDCYTIMNKKPVFKFDFVHKNETVEQKDSETVSNILKISCVQNQFPNKKDWFVSTYQSQIFIEKFIHKIEEGGNYQTNTPYLLRNILKCPICRKLNNVVGFNQLERKSHIKRYSWVYVQNTCDFFYRMNFLDRHHKL